MASCIPMMIAGTAWLAVVATPAYAADRLAALQESARPVVILANAPADPRVARQQAAFATAAAGLRERDVVVLVETNARGALHRRLGAAAFAVILLGKDGGVKRVWHEPVAPDRLFAVIDAMPMRQRETKGGR